MGLKRDGSGSNILNFPSSEVSAPVRVRQKTTQRRDKNLVTAEGLLLMQAFFKIASSEDRQKVIALAERLQGAVDRTAKD